MTLDARMDIRLPKKLKKEAEKYARRHNTNMSQLVVRLLTSLIKADRDKRNPPDAEQI